MDSNKEYNYRESLTSIEEQFIRILLILFATVSIIVFILSIESASSSSETTRLATPYDYMNGC
ncbi:MAG: hypothetical protein HOG49_10675 [Candidatus Scalindua sp.]|jgi:hypothetical protein|nr:hypothetical protein [Candidatus Scalindua sp.]